MFSTMPRMGTFSFWNIAMAFDATVKAKSCGVETITAPVSGIVCERLNWISPGTGDIQLSLCQTIPLTGAVIVSTPQDLALTVASKAIAMFQKLNVPILGIVENMSYYLCPKCGNREEIFGHGGAREAAKKLNFAFLGEIPLDLSIREQSDSGKPVALDDSTIYGKAFEQVAGALAAQISIGNFEKAQDIAIE